MGVDINVGLRVGLLFIHIPTPVLGYTRYFSTSIQCKMAATKTLLVIQEINTLMLNDKTFVFFALSSIFTSSTFTMSSVAL